MEALAALLFLMTSLFAGVALPIILVTLVVVWMVAALFWFLYSRYETNGWKWASIAVSVIALVISVNYGIVIDDILGAHEATEEILQETTED